MGSGSDGGEDGPGRNLRAAKNCKPVVIELFRVPVLGPRIRKPVVIALLRLFLIFIEKQTARLGSEFDDFVEGPKKLRTRPVPCFLIFC